MMWRIIQIVDISGGKSRCQSRWEGFFWDFNRKDFKSIFNSPRSYKEHVSPPVSKDTNDFQLTLSTILIVAILFVLALVIHIQMWALKFIENNLTTVD